VSAAGLLRVLVASLAAPDLYVSADAAMEALERESMFNVVDTATGWKADLIIRKSRSFSQVEFARRRGFDLEGNLPLGRRTRPCGAMAGRPGRAGGGLSEHTGSMTLALPRERARIA
jgi:hypothetical protein